MPLRVIEIDPADTFHSLRDRLLQNGRERTVLVVPTRGDPIGGVDLILLRRLADRERLDVGLVTADRALFRQARALGLPAFSSLTLAEHYRPGWWRAGRRSERVGFAPGDDRRPPERVAAEEAASLSAERGRRLAAPGALLSVVLIVGLLAVAAAFFLPQATITIHPEALPIQVIVELTADPGLAEATDTAIPARMVRLSQPWEATGPVTSDAADDEQRLRATALQGLAATAPELLIARLDPGELLIPASVQIEMANESFTQSADVSLLRQNAAITGLAVNAADVNALALARLVKALPEGYAPDMESLRLRIDPADGSAGQFEVTAQTTGQAQLDPAALAQALRGRTTADAAAYVAALPLAGPPSLDVGPAWWSRFGRLPLRAERIRVELLP